MTTEIHKLLCPSTEERINTDMFEHSFLMIAQQDISFALKLITGVFVGTLELALEWDGKDASGEIRIEGSEHRDITVHAKKKTAKALPPSP